MNITARTIGLARDAYVATLKDLSTEEKRDEYRKYFGATIRLLAKELAPRHQQLGNLFGDAGFVQAIDDYTRGDTDALADHFRDRGVKHDKLIETLGRQSRRELLTGDVRGHFALGAAERIFVALGERDLDARTERVREAFDLTANVLAFSPSQS